MSDIRIASRYAKSLLELAKERGSLEDVHHDMQLVASTVKENRELALLLKNPIVKNFKKWAVIKAIFGSKVNPLTYSFFEIVSRKNREAVLPSMASEFHSLYNIEKGIIHADVTTTFPLTEPMRREFVEIVKKISGKKVVELQEKINKDLIGGYILKVGDRQIDESIHSRLIELTSEFSHNPYVKEI